MAGVLQKFLIASIFMWILPLWILYGFNNDLFPGATTLSPHSVTLLNGILAVVSVNIVIAFYICMAMKEPADKHKPDAVFLAEAKDSVNKLTSETTDGYKAYIANRESFKDIVVSQPIFLYHLPWRFRHVMLKVLEYQSLRDKADRTQIV